MTKKKSKILEKIEKGKIPIWLMRQAGRYLPEYMEVRRSYRNFLDLCYDAKLASEVTIQPIDRFDLDAAIIFSDILVIPDALGMKVEFVESKGPILERIREVSEISKLKFNQEKLSPVYEAIEVTRKRLGKEKDLIGFAGSPWTIASYMLQGGGSRDFMEAKIFCFDNQEYFEELIEILIDVISQHLIFQVKAGCDVVKLFDSWSSALPEKYFDKFVFQANRRIAVNVKRECPEVPIIVFPKSCGFLYQKFFEAEEFDVVAIDQQVPFSEIRKYENRIFQGNLDPTFLLCEKEVLGKEIDGILENIGDRKLIFNLSHGVNKNSKIENIEFLVKKVRSYVKRK